MKKVDGQDAWHRDVIWGAPHSGVLCGMSGGNSSGSLPLIVCRAVLPGGRTGGKGHGRAQRAQGKGARDRGRGERGGGREQWRREQGEEARGQRQWEGGGKGGEGSGCSMACTALPSIPAVGGPAPGCHGGRAGCAPPMPRAQMSNNKHLFRMLIK